MQTLIGKKIGMTRVYDADGVQVPVTVVQVGPCTVVQRKSKDADGYEAVQLGFGEQKESRLGKPLQGHYKKAGAKAAKVLREVGAQVRPGDRIELRLAQGSLGCRVEEVEGEETHGKENL